MDFKPISDRLAVIRIKATLQNISIICAHAPTDDAEESSKEDFYDLLDRAYGACPEYDVKIVLGDFNAKIGKEDIFGGLVGKHSLHEETDNGFRLIDFAAARHTVISSTRFPRRKRSKELASGFRTRTQALRNSEGNLDTEEQGIVDVFKQHFQQLLNLQNVEQDNDEREARPVNEDPVPAPSREELERAIQKLKNNKSAGSDGIPAELFKHEGSVLMNRMHQVITKVLEEECIPTDWSIRSICPIYKKSDPMICKNYLDISLLNVAYKILNLSATQISARTSVALGQAEQR
ncbi:uncharacterized protein LOC129950414 [Eupeodes corollae]|uniref:uncharacterized protein LOC129950414 n=1 Tax=Eupeodes corollae TaxID=290404 RepID=UPI002492D33C|nr:uncharacterized protein LOC129950414 [Eupeodes corollae]